MQHVTTINFFESFEVTLEDPQKACQYFGIEDPEKVSMEIAGAFHNQPRQTLGDAIDGFYDLGKMGRFKMQENADYISVDELTQECGVIKVKHTVNGVTSKGEYSSKESVH